MIHHALIIAVAPLASLGIGTALIVGNPEMTLSTLALLLLFHIATSATAASCAALVGQRRRVKAPIRGRYRAPRRHDAMH